MTGDDSLLDKAGNRKYLNWAERKALFAVLREMEDIPKRTFCLTVFYTGCRISEALALTGHQIDEADHAVIFETLKQRKAGVFRAVPVPKIHTAYLLGLAEQCATFDDRLWPFSRSTAYRLIKAQMRKAGIRGVRASPKGLRHSYGVGMVSKKVPINLLQRWLGHARPETTAIYLNFVGDEERGMARELWADMTDLP